MISEDVAVGDLDGDGGVFAVEQFVLPNIYRNGLLAGKYVDLV